MRSPFGGDYRSDIDHSGEPELQVNSDGNLREAKEWRRGGVASRNCVGV